MRVINDKYQDDALLTFEKIVINPTIQVSVRSLHLHRGAYLGPNGTLQAHPYYFTLERIITEHGARFRADPEMAAHMRQFDRVEVCSDDDWLHEEGVLGDTTLAGTSISSVRIMEITRASAAATWAETPRPSQKVEDNKDFDHALAGAFASPSPLRERETGNARGSAAYQVPHHDAETNDAIPKARSRAAVSGGTPRWLAAAFIAFALATVVFVAAPDVRRVVLGIHDAPSPDDQRLERAGAAVARNCAMARSQAADFCAVEECVAPYRAQFPNGNALQKLNSIAAVAAANCDKSKQPRQLADAPKQQAAVVLTAQTQSVPPVLPTVTESVDAKEVEKLFGAARQCTAANPCLAPACYAEVQKKYATDAHADEWQAEVAAAAQLCSASPAAPLPDGVYNGRVAASCGAPQQFGIPVKVQGGTIAWRHDALTANGNAPVPVQWNGTISHDGTIHASAPARAGYQASGRYNGDEREIAMHYPGCVAMLSISARVK